MENTDLAPPPPANPLVAGAPPDRTYAVRFEGDGGAFFVLLLKNVLLTIVTLGIYAAWAKAERRRYIWSNTEIDGHRLLFTGTGKELFIAYLKVGAFYLAFALLPALLPSETGRTVVQVAFGILILALIPFAIYWSRAYLLSRTHWRGIRFGLAQGARPYAKMFILGYLLTLLTLGIYAPFWTTNLRRELTNKSRYGSQSFHYDGVGKEVFWISFKGFWLTLLTLGIYAFWWKAALTRYHLAHTWLGETRGRSQVTGGDFCFLFFLQLIGLPLTLGLAFPWITVYSLRRILAKITFHGTLDFELIAQRAAIEGASGDALADALDVGLGI